MISSGDYQGPVPDVKDRKYPERLIVSTLRFATSTRLTQPAIWNLLFESNNPFLNLSLKYGSMLNELATERHHNDQITSQKGIPKLK